jgi:membrane protein implicated in regulation of membrane protease activity
VKCLRASDLRVLARVSDRERGRPGARSHGGAAVVLALGELAIPGTFFVVSFAIGAAVAAVASFLGASVLVGWVCFVGGSALALAVLIPIGRRLNRAGGGDPTGATRWVGQRAVVLTAIPAGPHETGIVRLQREEWRAESADGNAIAMGTEVEVLRVDGTRVVVQAATGDVEATPPWPGRAPAAYTPPEPEPAPPHFREPQLRDMDAPAAGSLGQEDPRP